MGGVDSLTLLENLVNPAWLDDWTDHALPSRSDPGDLQPLTVFSYPPTGEFENPSNPMRPYDASPDLYTPGTPSPDLHAPLGVPAATWVYAGAAVIIAAIAFRPGPAPRRRRR